MFGIVDEYLNVFWLNLWISKEMGGWMDRWMNRLMDGWMLGWMDE